jgi:hypothetical protein
MSDATSLTIVRVDLDDEWLLPSMYEVEFNKAVSDEAPHNLLFLRATDELDAMRQVHEMITNGEIKEVTL